MSDLNKIALKILEDNKEALERLAEGLIVWETLDFTQVQDLVNGKDIGMPIVNDNPRPADQAAEETPVADSVPKADVQPTKDGSDDPLPTV